MIKALIAILFFLTPMLSYAEKPEFDTVKELKSENLSNKTDQADITPLEWVGYAIYAGACYALINSKDLVDNSYVHSRLEKTPLPYLKRPHIIRMGSLAGIGIGLLLFLSSDIRKYLKRNENLI